MVPRSKGNKERNRVSASVERERERERKRKREYVFLEVVEDIGLDVCRIPSVFTFLQTHIIHIHPSLRNTINKAFSLPFAHKNRQREEQRSREKDTQSISLSH
jgi:hypothetical protein